MWNQGSTLLLGSSPGGHFLPSSHTPIQNKELHNVGNYSIHQDASLNRGWFSQPQVEVNLLLLCQTCVRVETRRHSQGRLWTRGNLIAAWRPPISTAHH